MESKENSIALIINRKYLLISKKMTILKYDQVKLDDINYSKPEKMGTSYFGSFSFGETLQPLYIQTPKVKCNVNVSDLKDKKNPYLEIEIPKNNFDLYDLFLSIDDQNIKNTLYKSEDWFQKEIPLEAIVSIQLARNTPKPMVQVTYRRNNQITNLNYELIAAGKDQVQSHERHCEQLRKIVSHRISN